MFFKKLCDIAELFSNRLIKSCRYASRDCLKWTIRNMVIRIMNVVIFSKNLDYFSIVKPNSGSVWHIDYGFTKNGCDWLYLTGSNCIFMRPILESFTLFSFFSENILYRFWCCFSKRNFTSDFYGFNRDLYTQLNSFHKRNHVFLAIWPFFRVCLSCAVSKTGFFSIVSIRILNSLFVDYWWWNCWTLWI